MAKSNFLNVFEFQMIEDIQPGVWMSFSKVRLLPSASLSGLAQMEWDSARLYFSQTDMNLVLYGENGKQMTLCISASAQPTREP